LQKLLKQNISLAGNELDQIAHLIFRDRPGNIGLGNDTDQLMPINDWKTTDLMVLHSLDCFIDGIIGTNGDGFFTTVAAGSDVVGVTPIGNACDHNIAVS